MGYRYGRPIVTDWSRRELTVMRKLGACMTATNLTKVMASNRDSADVGDKRRSMGVKVPKEVIYKNMWTKEEDNILHEHGSKLPYTALAHMLPNRSKCAIVSRRRTLGIKYG
jgi:hypothetical protein